MMTLKIKYECDEAQEPLVSYRRQYSSCLRFAYNRFLEGKSEKEIRNLCKSLNHIDALGSWLIQSDSRNQFEQKSYIWFKEKFS